MAKKIAVLGTGALGAPIGGLLTQAGHDVVLIDQWAEHVEAMKANGLRITIGQWDEPELEYLVPVRAYHLYEAAALRPHLDVVFLACKSYDSCWLAEFVKPYLKSDGVLVSVQNSLNDEWIAPIIGHQRDIGCVLTAGGGDLMAPGHTWRDVMENSFMLGELHGRHTSRLDEVAEILGDASTVALTTNIWGAKWTKLVVNCMAGALAGATGKLTRQLYHDRDCRTAAVKMGLEAVRVGLALGYAMEPIRGEVPIDEIIASPDLLLAKVPAPVLAPGKEARNMISQDLAKGRRTEVDYLNGLICRKGDEAGVATPVNRSAVELIHRLERGELQPDAANVRLLAIDD